MNEPIGYDKDGNEVALEDILQSPEEVEEKVARHLQQEKIQKHLQQLTPQEQEVLNLRYGIKDGIRETQRKIAQKLHISRSYVSRIEKRALKKMIDDMEKKHAEQIPKSFEETGPKQE